MRNKLTFRARALAKLHRYFNLLRIAKDAEGNSLAYASFARDEGQQVLEITYDESIHAGDEISLSILVAKKAGSRSRPSLENADY